MHNPASLNTSIVMLLIVMVGVISGHNIARGQEPLAVLTPPAVPSCEADYSSPVFTVNGSTINKPAGGLYCVTNDGPYVRGKSDLLDKLSDAVSRVGAIERVTISTNYIDSTFVGEWLCSFSVSQPKLTIIVQRAKEVFNRGTHLGGDVTAKVLSCFTNVEFLFVGCDVFEAERLDYECPKGQTNSHHIKGIVFKGRSGSVYAFGSGNLSLSSTTRNVEDWVLFSSIEPILQFECLMDFSATLARNPSLRYIQQKAIYEGCTALAAPLNGIRVYVLPFARDGFRAEFEKNLSNSTKVTIVGQFIESEWLFSLIEKYPDVEFIFLVDSSYYYSRELARQLSENEKFDEDTLRTLNYVQASSAIRLASVDAERENVTVRYLQTNSNAVQHNQANTIHARSALFQKPEGPALLVGSAHWRDGSYARNTEQEFFLYAGAAAIQSATITDLIKRSVEVGELPRQQRWATVAVTPDGEAAQPADNQ